MPDNTGENPVTISDIAQAGADRKWGNPLVEDGWECEYGRFGEADLCVSTKRWADGTVDVLIAHTQFSPPIAYAHRHPAPGLISFITYGPADDVVNTVINQWELPISPDERRRVAPAPEFDHTFEFPSPGGGTMWFMFCWQSDKDVTDCEHIGQNEH